MILEVAAPLDALGYPRSTLPAGVTIAFERTAAVTGRGPASLHIEGDAHEVAVHGFRANPYVNAVTPVTETDDGYLYRLDWGDALPSLLEGVHRHGGTVLSATAEGDRWTLGLRFPDHESANGFYDQYTAGNGSLSVDRTAPQDRGSIERPRGLTPEQAEALDRAIEAGYFEIPRGTTLTDLGDDLGISDTAVSQRLRRGLLTVLEERMDQPSVAEPPRLSD